MHLGLRSHNAIVRSDGALAQCSHSARKMQPFCPQAFFALDGVGLPGVASFWLIGVMLLPAARVKVRDCVRQFLCWNPDLRCSMNYLASLSTFQQMTLFAALVIFWAVAATFGAIFVAHRQNKRFADRSSLRNKRSGRCGCCGR